MPIPRGADAKLVTALEKATAEEGATLEFIGPKIGGFTDSDGKLHPVQQNVNGGPSVLYDAVAIVTSAEGAKLLAREVAAKDFVSDAFAHAKFIAYAEAAMPLLNSTGITPDEGFIRLKFPKDAADFIARCRQLRLWVREESVHAV